MRSGLLLVYVLTALAVAIIDRLPQLHYIGAHIKQMLHDKLVEHITYIAEYGDDLPEVRDWKWGDYSNPDSVKATTGESGGADFSASQLEEGAARSRS